MGWIQGGREVGGVCLLHLRIGFVRGGLCVAAVTKKEECVFVYVCRVFLHDAVLLN
jgi:hypothetical protein